MFESELNFLQFTKILRGIEIGKIHKSTEHLGFLEGSFNEEFIPRGAVTERFSALAPQVSPHEYQTKSQVSSKAMSMEYTGGKNGPRLP